MAGGLPLLAGDVDRVAVVPVRREACLELGAEERGFALLRTRVALGVLLAVALEAAARARRSARTGSRPTAAKIVPMRC